MFRMIPCGKLAAKSAAQISSSRLGIGFEKLDRDAFDPNKAYEKLSKIGVKWVRIQSGWQKTEQQKGVYDFAWLDAIVDNLLARDLLPWINVSYGNRLYGGMAEEVFGAVGCPPIFTDEQKAAWRNYCQALTEHFRGRVTHFEIWNEPDGTHCWKHGVSATELGYFTIDTAKALREGNPDCYVIGGVVCHFPTLYLNEAFKTGMAQSLDAISFHTYTYDETDLEQRILNLKGLIELYNPSLELIQGESGSQSRFGGRGALRVGAWTPKKQCKQLLRHLVTDLGMGVKFTSYFSCLDMMEALNGVVSDKASYQDYGYFGVLGAEFDENGVATGDYPPKPSYYALQSLASLLGGDLRSATLPVYFKNEIIPHTGKRPSVAFRDTRSFGFRLNNGSYAFAYWMPTDYMTSDTEDAVTLCIADLGEVHLVDPMDGTIYEIPDTILSRDEFGGTTMTGLPIRDYPLFLVFGSIE